MFSHKKSLSKHRSAISRRGHPVRGVSLIELMIGMVIALLIAAAIGSLYVGSKESFRVQDGFSSLRESGLATSELISREVRKAGNFGCFRWRESVWPPLTTTAKLPSGTGDRFTLPTITVDGKVHAKLGPAYDAFSDTVTSLTLPPKSVLVPKPGTDYLQIAYGQPVSFLADNMLDDDGVPSAHGKLKLGSEVDVKSGQPMLIADCDAMQLIRSDNDGKVKTISHDPGSGDNVALTNSRMASAGLGYGAVVMRLTQTTMFVAADTTGRESLYLWDTHEAPAGNEIQPFAVNVIDLRTLVSLDGAAGLEWRTAVGLPAADWARVRGVRVDYVVRSGEATPGLKPKALTWDPTLLRYVESKFSAPGEYAQRAYSVTTAIRGRVDIRS